MVQHRSLPRKFSRTVICISALRIYRAKTLPFSGALSCTALKPKHVGKNEKAIQGFNECLQGVDINELFEEFTEASVVKQSVNQQQIFNNCSVTIVYKKD